MISKPKIEVCLSPALLHKLDLTGKIVVIIDIFRATSTIVTALDNGAKAVVPTASVAECIHLGKTIPDSVTAGERNGMIAPGLKYGNSPLTYSKGFIEGKILLLTTTNGTRLLKMIENSTAILIGAFLNLTALSSHIHAQQKDLVLTCAAWKDKVNLEDALFAGAVIHQLFPDFDLYDDSSRMVHDMYQFSLQQGSIYEYLQKCTHYHRLAGYGLEEDLKYATQLNTHPVVPYYNGQEILLIGT